MLASVVKQMVVPLEVRAAPGARAHEEESGLGME
jgi:hypothetical protein